MIRTNLMDPLCITDLATSIDKQYWQSMKQSISRVYQCSKDVHIIHLRACTEYLNLENGKASNPVFAELNRINARLEVIYQEVKTVWKVVPLTMTLQVKVVQFGVKDSDSVTKRTCCVIV